MKKILLALLLINSYVFAKNICVNTIIGQDRLTTIKLCISIKESLIQAFQEKEIKELLISNVALSQEKKMIISHQKTHLFIEKEILKKYKKNIKIISISSN